MTTLDDVLADLDRRMLAALLAVPPRISPEPLRCPVCGMTWTKCRQVFRHDPVHEAAIRRALDAD